MERIVYRGRIYTRDPDSKTPSRRMYFRRPQYDRRTGAYLQKLLHRQIWEDRNGPIPRDCIIHHIDGNPLNNDISNLKCTLLRDHMSVYHTERKYKNAKEKECIRCNKTFQAKTKRSRFCPTCINIFIHNSKEKLKWYQKSTVRSTDSQDNNITISDIKSTEKERTKYKNHTYVRDPNSKNKTKRIYFRRKFYDPTTGKIRQELLHRVIWSDHNGPVPPGSIIRHKDGNPSNNEISNLECVNKQEHLKTCRTRAVRNRGI